MATVCDIFIMVFPKCFALLCRSTRLILYLFSLLGILKQVVEEIFDKLAAARMGIDKIGQVSVLYTVDSCYIYVQDIVEMFVM